MSQKGSSPSKDAVRDLIGKYVLIPPEIFPAETPDITADGEGWLGKITRPSNIARHVEVEFPGKIYPQEERPQLNSSLSAQGNKNKNFTHVISFFSLVRFIYSLIIIILLQRRTLLLKKVQIHLFVFMQVTGKFSIF